MLHKTIKLGDAVYPSLLKEISDPPEAIYIRGDLLDNEPRIAIVGTRKASEGGRVLAGKLASELCKKGFTIVSGLALGIDSAAHKGALSVDGVTIAVLGNAIDHVYPESNRGLANHIIKKGAVISEYGPGEDTQKINFIQRNRIISGLSSAVLVIEAPERSGALATARFAAEQGRDVFVIPGNVHDPNYIGSHQLIRDGAILVKSIEDILEDVRLT